MAMHQTGTMDPRQAIAVLHRFGITERDLPEVAAAVQALVEAGFVETGPAPSRNAMLMPAGGRPGTVPGRAPAPEPFGDPAAADNMPRGTRGYR